MARSRRPFVVVASGVFRSVCACCIESQFPIRTPLALTPLIRVTSRRPTPGASSPVVGGFDRQLCSTAVMRTLIEIEPSPRDSRATRHALTVALVKPGLGSFPYQETNSSKPRL